MKVVEEIISQAIEAGESDKLLGEGRPLRKDIDTGDPAQAATFRLLRR